MPPRAARGGAAGRAGKTREAADVPPAHAGSPSRSTRGKRTLSDTGVVMSEGAKGSSSKDSVSSSPRKSPRSPAKASADATGSVVETSGSTPGSPVTDLTAVTADKSVKVVKPRMTWSHKALIELVNTAFDEAYYETYFNGKMLPKQKGQKHNKLAAIHAKLREYGQHFQKESMPHSHTLDNKLDELIWKFKEKPEEITGDGDDESGQGAVHPATDLYNAVASYVKTAEEHKKVCYDELEQVAQDKKQTQDALDACLHHVKPQNVAKAVKKAKAMKKKRRAGGEDDDDEDGGWPEDMEMEEDEMEEVTPAKTGRQTAAEFDASLLKSMQTGTAGIKQNAEANLVTAESYKMKAQAEVIRAESDADTNKVKAEADLIRAKTEADKARSDEEDRKVDRQIKQQQLQQQMQSMQMMAELLKMAKGQHGAAGGQ